MIFVIDDDEIMAECVAKACGEKEVRIFSDAIAAMRALGQGLPEMIFMDVMLTGPDGFSFLNETMSYADTMNIPVVIISAVDFGKVNLGDYGVVGILKKETMKPEDIKDYVERYC